MLSLGTFVGGILVVLAAVVELLVLGIVRFLQALLGRRRKRRAARLVRRRVEPKARPVARTT